MIQLETAKALAQRYLGPTVVVLLVLLGSVAGGMAWVWSQNETLNFSQFVGGRNDQNM